MENGLSEIREAVLNGQAIRLRQVDGASVVTVDGVEAELSAEKSFEALRDLATVLEGKVLDAQLDSASYRRSRA